MTAWRQHAACRGVDPNIFHPAGSDGYELARSFCARCPVTRQCLEAALEVQPCYDQGMWGGFTAQQRRKIRNQPNAA